MFPKQTRMPLELIDALEQVIINPNGRHHWRRLNIVYSKNNDPLHQAQAKKIILNEVKGHGDYALLRDTFLAYTCGDESYIPKASKYLLSNAINQPDKTTTFINYEIGRIMSSPISRSKFETELNEKKIPDLIYGLARALGKTKNIQSALPPIDGRIAIYTSNICSAAHPPTKLILQHARLLYDLGYTVQIFCSQEEHIRYAEEYLGNGGICIPKPFDPNQFQEYLGNRKIPFSFGQIEYSLKTRWKSIIQLIQEFQPQLIFFIGLHSPITEVLYPSFPILGLSINSTPPIASCDLWLSANDNEPSSSKPAWNKPISLGKSFFYPYRVERRIINQEISKKELGLTSNMVALISVGARLNNEISGEWAEQLRVLLCQNPNTVWFLVGGEGEFPEALNGVPESQIRCIKHTRNLTAIYQCCDIYINPPRLGGGFSVAEAMAEGLPVVTYSNSDGGNKLGSLAVRDLKTYLTLCQKLISDPDLRQKYGNEMIKIFEMNIDINKASLSLQSAIQECLTNSKQRLSVHISNKKRAN